MALKYFWGAKHKGRANGTSKRFIPNKWHDLFHKTPLLSLQRRGLIGRLFLCASPVIVAMLGFHRNLCEAWIFQSHQRKSLRADSGLSNACELFLSKHHLPSVKDFSDECFWLCSALWRRFYALRSQTRWSSGGFLFVSDDWRQVEHH